MNHKKIRIILAAIEAFIGLGAAGGGLAILTGAFDQWFPVTWLQGTPFNDYLVPGLVLLIVVGGGMLLAAITLFSRREFALLFSAAMGLVMIGWEIIEVLIIDRYEQAVIPSTIVQQVLFTALGLIIVGLAAFLWAAEYRGQSFHAGHSSQS
jgi:hypothetical protein